MWETECKHQHIHKAPRCDVRQAETPPRSGKSVEKVEGVKRRRGVIEVRGLDAAEAALKLASVAVQRAWITHEMMWSTSA